MYLEKTSFADVFSAAPDVPISTDTTVTPPPPPPADDVHIWGVAHATPKMFFVTINIEQALTVSVNVLFRLAGVDINGHAYNVDSSMAVAAGLTIKSFTLAAPPALSTLLDPDAGVTCTVSAVDPNPADGTNLIYGSP